MDYEDWDCAYCGVKAHMPIHVHRTLMESGWTFYCVYGHSNYYPREKPHREEVQTPEPKIVVELAEPDLPKSWFKRKPA